VATERYKAIVKALPDPDEREVMRRELDWLSVYDQFMVILGP